MQCRKGFGESDVEVTLLVRFTVDRSLMR
jgi:hypothetical protein